MTNPTPKFSNFRAEYTSADRTHRVVVTDRAYNVKVTTFRRRKSGRSYQVIDTQRFQHCSFERLCGLAQRIVAEVA